MSTTELEHRPQTVSLFNGATPDQITLTATDVATRFSDIVKRQRMFKRIGDRDHILIEAWQTIGTLTGVFATEAGGVRELPWPDINQMVWIADEPPHAGPEPRNRDTDDYRTWKPADELRKSYDHHQTIIEAHTLGRSWGYAAAFRAVQNGREVGWGEGRVDRAERTWAGRDDYALASMAQTRGQSRALGAPLRFIVKLAGYEPTLPDEMPPEAAQSTRPDLPWGPTSDADEDLQKAVELVKAIAPGVDGAKFIVDMAAYFNGIPEANLKMLRGLLRRIGETHAAQTPESEAVS
jgi:hypothetical protein